jgi:uroporphyrinogen decarboxylase
MMGLEALCIAFYEQPALVERMMEQRADAIIAITEEVLRYTRFEVFWFWEDMAYNHGPLLDPKMFRRFALPHYRRVCDWLKAHGIRHIWLDSDGSIPELIPIWLDAGINGLWPFEVQAGMDVVEVRRTYGHDLALAGGIPKQAVAEGGEAMRRAVDRVMPLVEDGGYFPELDHSAPPDISWPGFCEYITYLSDRLGRG